jgi:hypothetical protein
MIVASCAPNCLKKSGTIRLSTSNVKGCRFLSG